MQKEEKQQQHHSLITMTVVLQLNLVLMAFNLLIPAYPLDGGRILVDLLLIVGVPATITAWITIVLAVLCGVGLITVGALNLYFGYGGIMIGIFILFSTFQLFQAVQSGNIERHPLFKPPSTGQGNPAQPKDSQPAASNV